MCAYHTHTGGEDSFAHGSVKQLGDCSRGDLLLLLLLLRICPPELSLLPWRFMAFQCDTSLSNSWINFDGLKVH